jgi:hypothetical protein
MTQEERKVILSLAQCALLSAGELSLLGKDGYTSFAGHPSYEALMLHFQPLLDDLQEPEIDLGTTEASLHKVLQKVLEEVKALGLT